MFILDEPYISDYLITVAAERGLPVLDTPLARRRFEGTGVELVSSADFAEEVMSGNKRVYANSENAIGWIAENLASTDLPRQIAVLKDKVRFRELVQPLHPEMWFREVALDELERLDVAAIHKPFVIKPAVGFFSLGVHVVDSDAAWPGVVEAIRTSVAGSAALYPEQVLGMERFIIEQVIEGEEFAVDAYFRADGRPVIVDIMGHLFAGEEDVSDRVYYTSPTLIETWRERFQEYLAQVGSFAGLHDFPVHAELRVTSGGQIVPIEINPMRFGGWCAADMAWRAWGENPYAHYLDDTEPDWKRIIEQHRGQARGLVVADIASSVDLRDIRSVDYDAFVSRFAHPLDLRRTDFNKQPVFAFLFVRVPEDDMSELEAVLHADLGEYLRFE